MRSMFRIPYSYWVAFISRFNIDGNDTITYKDPNPYPNPKLTPLSPYTLTLNDVVTHKVTNSNPLPILQPNSSLIELYFYFNKCYIGYSSITPNRGHNIKSWL